MKGGGPGPGLGMWLMKLCSCNNARSRRKKATCGFKMQAGRWAWPCTSQLLLLLLIVPSKMGGVAVAALRPRASQVTHSWRTRAGSLQRGSASPGGPR